MLDFMDAEIPMDTAPDFSDVEYPCVDCGKEAGPYGGRGPKPKYCPDHKKGSASKKSGSVKVTGTNANLAAQATKVLVQLNGILAVGLMAATFFETAKALAGANDGFEIQAHEALLTDPDLCRLICKGGVKSARMGLGLAYVGLGVAVVPTAVNEFREKKAERDARREAEADEQA